MATVETARAEHAAPPADGRRVERWYSVVDTIAHVGLLNLLVLAFTLAGGIVLGWAPALSAAVTVSRTRVRGGTEPVVRTFARRWVGGFGHANLLAAPSAVTLALLGTSFLTLRDSGHGALQVGIAVAAGLCLVHLVLVLTMDAHYDLRRRDCLRLAWAFLVRFPGAPLLLAATTALVVVASAFVPGLIPVISVGAWVYLCTALCLSFYAANDRNLHDAALAARAPLDE